MLSVRIWRMKPTPAGTGAKSWRDSWVRVSHSASAAFSSAVSGRSPGPTIDQSNRTRPQKV